MMPKGFLENGSDQADAESFPRCDFRLRVRGILEVHGERVRIRLVSDDLATRSPAIVERLPSSPSVSVAFFQAVSKSAEIWPSARMEVGFAPWLAVASASPPAGAKSAPTP